jgi:hypothetical protein
MNAKALWLILAAVLILGFAILRYRARMNSLRIDPHAAEEIDKAKRR